MTAEQSRQRKAINRARNALNLCATDLVSLTSKLNETKSVLAARSSINDCTVELFAALRELEESDDDTTPIRSPSRMQMAAVRGIADRVTAELEKGKT